MKSFREFMIGEARILDRQEAIQKAIDFGPSNLYDEDKMAQASLTTFPNSFEVPTCVKK